MSLELAIALLTLAAWLSGPVLGVIGGALAGYMFRQANLTIDVNSKVPTGYFIGSLIGIAVSLLGIAALGLLIPGFWTIVNTEEFWIRTSVSWLLCTVIGEFTMVRIANDGPAVIGP